LLAGSEAIEMLIVSAIIAVLLLGYLLYALVRPERLG
jgi:K+-transporting ATPase KdpF subunit